MSTRLTQVFAQSARMQQAVGTFCLLSPTADVLTPFGLFRNSTPKDLLPRLKRGCSTQATHGKSRYYHTPSTRLCTRIQCSPRGNLWTAQFSCHWKKGQTARHWCRRWFFFYTSKGDETSLCSIIVFKDLINIVEKYNFGWINGKQWNKFLTQFNITTDDLPQVLVLNVPTKSYWHDSSFPNIGDFLQAVRRWDCTTKRGGPCRKRTLESNGASVFRLLSVVGSGIGGGPGSLGVTPPSRTRRIASTVSATTMTKRWGHLSHKKNRLLQLAGHGGRHGGNEKGKVINHFHASYRLF